MTDCVALELTERPATSVQREIDFKSAASVEEYAAPLSADQSLVARLTSFL